MGLSSGGESQPLGPRPREFDAVNHQGTINVLDAALAAGAERVLHTSTESILTMAAHDRADRRGRRDRAGGHGRPLLPVEAAGRKGCVRRWPARGRPWSSPIRRCRSGRAIAALSPPTRLILDSAADDLPGRHGLHTQSDRRPGRGDGTPPRHGSGETRTAIPARKRESDASRPLETAQRVDGRSGATVACFLSRGTGLRGVQ